MSYQGLDRRVNHLEEKVEDLDSRVVRVETSSPGG
jgi:hypothetical protein